MTALQGTIKNGEIILDAPAALPEGTRVEVLPIDGARPTLGMARGRVADDRRGDRNFVGSDGPGRARVVLAGRRRRLAEGVTRAERIREDPVPR